MKKQKKILFFINRAKPTVEEVTLANSMDEYVTFRYNKFIPEIGVGGPEECDAVMGDVPQLYAHLPRIDMEVANTGEVDLVNEIIEKPQGETPKFKPSTKSIHNDKTKW